MDPKQKGLLILAAVMLATALTAWLWLPPVVDGLPGQIRVRLPEGFLALVTTPLPTALPAPLQPAEAELPNSPVWPTDRATPTMTPTATRTPAWTNPAGAETSTPRPATITPIPSPTMTPSPTAVPLPEFVRLAGLKVTPQKYNNCGPANLSIVLNYYGRDAHQLDIGKALKPNYDDRNVTPGELIRYVDEETDLDAIALYGLELEVLKRLLAADFPVIIEKGLDLSASHGWMGHYLTLYGYDDQADVFYGLDTFLGPWDSTGKEFEYESLEELWAQFNRAAIVVYPRGQAADMAQTLGPDLLDEETMWLAAAERAQSALDLDADDAFAWFDLGASLYHLAVLRDDDALYRQSAASIDRAREIGLPWRTMWYQFEPYMAYLGAGRYDEVLALTEAVMTTSGGRNIEETYLFRGHALLASGDLQGAKRAYERALRLNPGFDAARDALQALAEPTAEGTGGG